MFKGMWKDLAETVPVVCKKVARKPTGPELVVDTGAWLGGYVGSIICGVGCVSAGLIGGGAAILVQGAQAALREELKIED